MLYDHLEQRLAERGVRLTLHEHAPLRRVEEHQAQLPFDPARFLKTLAFRAGDARWLLVALRGEDRLDYRRLADAIGVPRAAVAAATTEEVERVFGCEPGAVSPIPAHEGITVLVDTAAAALAVVYTGSGRSDRTLEIQMDDLLRVVAPRVLPLRREHPAG